MLFTHRMLYTLQKLYFFPHFNANKDITAALWGTLKPTTGGLVMNYIDGLINIFHFLIAPIKDFPPYTTNNNDQNDQAIEKYEQWLSSQLDKFHVNVAIGNLLFKVVNPPCIKLLTHTSHDAFGLDGSTSWNTIFDEYVKNIFDEYSKVTSETQSLAPEEKLVWNEIPNRLHYVLDHGAWQHDPQVLPPLGTRSPILCSAWIVEIAKMFEEVATPIYMVSFLILF